jgi:hypothetical protein
MASQRRRYRFVIDESFTPDTLPMWRLAEYMMEIADLLGEKPYVHFVEIGSGSTVLVQDVEHEAYPKVRTRVHDVKRGEGPPDARRAYESLNRKLATDNASGTLVEELEPNAPAARVLDFPGRKMFVESEYGPLTQAGTLQGVVIVVGGESDPVPVHIEDGAQVYVCRAKRPIAKELAAHIFGQPVRVEGNGRWFRDAMGLWIMRSFQIASFVVLEDTTLSNVVATLRQVPGKWKDRPDALSTLKTLRSGEA